MSAEVPPIRPGKQQSALPPVWLSPEQVCERVPGMTTVILEKLRAKGKGPRFFKPSLKTVIYEQSEIDRWVASTAVSTRDS